VRRRAGAASDSSDDDDDDMAQLQTLLQGGPKPTAQSRQLARLLQRAQPQAAAAAAAGTPDSEKVGMALWPAVVASTLQSCAAVLHPAVHQTLALLQPSHHSSQGNCRVS
jgi:hypothetical protein